MPSNVQLSCKAVALGDLQILEVAVIAAACAASPWRNDPSMTLFNMTPDETVRLWQALDRIIMLLHEDNDALVEQLGEHSCS